MRKRWHIFLAAALFLAVLGSAAAVYADSGGAPAGDPPAQGQGRRPPPPRGLRGEVTAVSETGLTLLTRGDVSVQVNVDGRTQVWLVETQSQGALEDIEVGDRILAQGRRAEGSTPDAPALDARWIVVAPDGDEAHGRVTAVEGSAITLASRQPDNPEGEVIVVANDDTAFRVGRQEGSLSDVIEGVRLAAFGELQSDGSLLARLVIVDNRPPPPPPVRTLRGEVTAVDTTGLTLLTRNEVSVQVNAGENTKVWLVETQRQGVLEDVEVGDQVLIKGTRAEDSQPDAPAMDARAIVVAPDGDEMHGRVTAVEGDVITLAVRQPENREGQATIVTGEDTGFWLGRREGSLEDVTEGRFVVAFGETQADGSLLARLVYIHRGPPDQPPGPPPGQGAGQGGDQLPDLWADAL